MHWAYCLIITAVFKWVYTLLKRVHTAVLPYISDCYTVKGYVTDSDPGYDGFDITSKCRISDTINEGSYTLVAITKPRYNLPV